MLVLRKRDWFSVVATDLFCGVLAAVIILDAVTPKEASSAGSEVLLTLVYKSASRQPGEPPNTCQVNNVVFQFRDAATTYNTLDAISTASLVDGNCRVEAFFPDVNVEQDMSNTVVVVAQYAGELERATVFMTGLLDIECRKDDIKCPIL